LEDCQRGLQTVEAKNKFSEVVLQIFRVNLMISAVEPILEIAESALNMQRLSVDWLEAQTQISGRLDSREISKSCGPRRAGKRHPEGGKINLLPSHDGGTTLRTPREQKNVVRLEK